MAAGRENAWCLGNLIEDLNIAVFADNTTEHGVNIVLKGDPPFFVGYLLFKVFLAFFADPFVTFRCYP